jgi:hypothetical protein
MAADFCPLDKFLILVYHSRWNPRSSVFGVIGRLKIFQPPTKFNRRVAMNIKRLVRLELKKKNGKTEMAAELAPGVILVGEIAKLKVNQVWEKKVTWDVWFDPTIWEVMPFVHAEVTDLLKGGKIKRMTLIVPDLAYGIPSIIAQVWGSLKQTHRSPWKYWYKQPKIIGLPAVSRALSLKGFFRFFYRLAEFLRFR